MFLSILSLRRLFHWDGNCGGGWVAQIGTFPPSYERWFVVRSENDLKMKYIKKDLHEYVDETDKMLEVGQLCLFWSRPCEGEFVDVLMSTCGQKWPALSQFKTPKTSSLTYYMWPDEGHQLVLLARLELGCWPEFLAALQWLLLAPLALLLRLLRLLLQCLLLLPGLLLSSGGDISKL